ncbi:hypothetical protein C8R43DRAFT_1240221 [Mycena crocata]|nr:hypothetical protein C8R43DRAFT_1240221 [Mycena crocata]
MCEDPTRDQTIMPPSASLLPSPIIQRGNLPMSSLIHTFPTEILTQIFKTADRFSDEPNVITVVLSHVCRRWRAVAVFDSSMWLWIGVRSRDMRHTGFLNRLFQRSKKREINIQLNFWDMYSAVDPGLFWHLLHTVRDNLHRTRSLFIYAQWPVWRMIIAAFRNQAYASLGLLDIELVVPPVVRGRSQMARFATSTADTLDSNPIAIRSAPPPPIVFHLPRQHPLLERLRLSGISVGNIPLPSLALLRISGDHNPHLIGADGRLSRWLLQSAENLSFEDMAVPPMPLYVPEEISKRAISPVKHLLLSGLTSTRNSGPGHDRELEHNSAPFFDALFTPRARCLEIERWDLTSRVWTDFLTWLPDNIRFPWVSDLRITGMHFPDMDYVDVAFFLGSFPYVRHLRLEDCLPGTWEAALTALEMSSSLCPRLKSIRLSDDLVVLRNDPLPFRHGVAV